MFYNTKLTAAQRSGVAISDCSRLCDDQHPNELPTRVRIAVARGEKKHAKIWRGGFFALDLPKSNKQI